MLSCYNVYRTYVLQNAERFVEIEMRKTLAIFVIMSLLLVAVGCESNDVINERPVNGDEATVVPDVETDTMGANIWDVFYNAVKNGKQSPESIAHKIIEDRDVFPYDGDVVPVEPGYMVGFDNYEVTGFEDGVVFMPMISVIPFVGYVFTLDGATDAKAFLEQLEENCNTRWTISTRAEQVVAGACGNLVLFVMCPEAPDGAFGR